MSFDLRVLPAVEHDIEDAVRWYGARAPQQADRLIQELASVLSRIQDAPKMFPIAYRTIRRAPLRIFPYFVWFLVDAEARRVEVLAVTHQRRDPATTRARFTR